MNNKRFIPLKRTAIDGRNWWVIWDNKKDKWATLYGLTARFKTKKDCQLHIDCILKIRYNNSNKILLEL